MKISIVVIVRNEEKRIHDFLESLIIQEHVCENEVIFIDGDSSDNTVKIIKEYADRYQFIRFIECSTYGYSYQRNIGVVNAKGEYILYVSGDTILSKNLIKKYLSYVNKYDVIQGTIVNTDNNSTLSKNFYKICSKLYNNHINTNCETFSTVNVCIKKELLLNEKFDETLNSFEDKEWFLKYEKLVRYKRVKSAIIYHLVHENVKQYCKKVYKEAAALGIIIERNRTMNWKKELNFFGWPIFSRNIMVSILMAILLSTFMFFNEKYLLALIFIFLPIIYKYIYVVKKMKGNGNIISEIEGYLYGSMFFSVIWTGVVKGYVISKKQRFK